MSQFQRLGRCSSVVVYHRLSLELYRCDRLLKGVYRAHPVWGDASAKVHVGGWDNVCVCFYAFVSGFLSFCFTSVTFLLSVLLQIIILT